MFSVLCDCRENPSIDAQCATNIFVIFVAARIIMFNAGPCVKSVFNLMFHLRERRLNGSSVVDRVIFGIRVIVAITIVTIVGSRVVWDIRV